MGKIYIKKITLEGFRGFVNQQSTEELPTSGLVGIRGTNLDTGGSSGAGKSGIIYAICYAFGLLDKNWSKDKLQCKWTKTPLQVELLLETPEGPTILRRGKITSIQVGSEVEISGSVAAVNDRLRKIIGVDGEVLKALTFRQQGRPGMFLSMKDSVKKSFLSGLLGLEEIEVQIKDNVTKVNKIKDEIDKLQLVVSSLQQQLHLPVEKAIITIDYSKVIKPDIETDLSLEKELDIYNHEYVVLEKQELDKNKANRDELQILRKLADSLVNKIAFEESLQKDIKKLQNNILVARNGTCPLCNRTWLQQHNHIVSWENKIQESSKELAKIATCRVELFDYRDQIKKKEQELQVVIPEKITLRNKIDDLKRQIMEEKFQNQLKFEKYNALIREIKLAEQHNQSEEERFKRELQRYIELGKQITDYINKSKTLQLSFNREQDYVSGLKAFLGSIFDEILNEIALEANELLRSFPNTSTVTLQFNTEKTTEIRQEIKTILMKNGQEMDFEVEFSGGQGTSIELAVDLAVKKVIANRKGGNLPGWQILDESFEGHDIIVKEGCLEILQKAARDSLILIVDHASELKEYFTRFIDVESKNDISRIL